MPFAELKDARLFYQWDGSESAPALVFCNSLGTTHRMWDAQVGAFSQHFRVLRYDSRGHGQSSVTPGPYSIVQLANDVVHLLDALKLDRVYFCGLSLGAMTGMYLGSQAANRFHKMALCNTAAKIGNVDAWNTRIATVEKEGMKAVAGSVIERWLTTGYRGTHPKETGEMLGMLQNANCKGYAASCAAVRDMDYREKLSQIRVPTLIVAGTHDPVTTPADGHFLQERIPGAQYTELSAAHISNVEACFDFNREVLGFLRGMGAHG